MSRARPYKIVSAVDFSDMSDVVLDATMDLAGRHDAPEIHVLAVLTPSRGFLERRGSVDHSAALEEVAGRLRDVVGEKLADFGRPFGSLNGWRISTHAREGDPAEQIADLAWEAEADLIILGRHSDLRRRFLLLGSVPQRVMQLARCPVLIAQATDYARKEESASEHEQCPECLSVRSESGGDRWFCTEHSDIRLTRSMYMAHHSTTWPIGGGPLL